MNLIAVWTASEPGALSLLFLGTALLVVGVRRRQAAELALALVTGGPRAESRRD